jgi:Raf kinase inhibitor-like YbhB/YbcL family protein
MAMKHSARLFASLAIGAVAAAIYVEPGFGANLKVAFEKHDAGNTIPATNASCVGTADGKSAQGTNKSPAVSWSQGPSGTRSYALTLVDSDVAIDKSGSNKDGVSIPVSAKRREFVHWVLADIPATRTSLEEGANVGRHGQNGASEAAYKGPCPPWNDERFHHYHITVYALDVDRLELPDPFNRADLLKAAKGRILASGSATLRYATNAKARE